MMRWGRSSVRMCVCLPMSSAVLQMSWRTPAMREHLSQGAGGEMDECRAYAVEGACREGKERKDVRRACGRSRNGASFRACVAWLSCEGAQQ